MSIETPPELSQEERQALTVFGIQSLRGEMVQFMPGTPILSMNALFSLELRGFLEIDHRCTGGRPTQAGWAVIAQEALVSDIDRAQKNVERWEDGQIQ